jgi:hypothetical protein
MLSRGSMTHSAAHTQVELRVGRGAARQQSSRTTARQADRSAITVQLERDLHIGNTSIGLLVTVSTAVGAIATETSG